MRRAISTPLAVAIIVIVLVVSVGSTYYFVKMTTTAPVSTSVSTSGLATSTSVSGGIMVLEEASGPGTLDPAAGFDNPSIEAADNVYQALVSYTPNLTIVPLLAQNYSVSSDGLRYTFWLRPNIMFSNGHPFNAYAAWYNFYRASIIAQEYATLVDVPLNMTGVTADMLNTFNSTNNVPPATLLQVMENPKLAITVINAYEFEFNLATPFSAFIGDLSALRIFVDPYAVTNNGGVVAGQPNTWLVTHAVGTGPFMVTQDIPSTVTVYQRNPYYWGGAYGVSPTPRIAEIIEKVVPNALTRLEDVERGSAQLAYVGFEQGPELAGAAGVYVPNSGAMRTIQYMTFDTQKFPFNQLLIRQAAVHAVNNTEMVGLFHGFATSFVGPLAKGMLGYNYTLQPYAYNLTLARQLLVQAGYPGGVGIPPVTMMYATDEAPADLEATLIQASLAQIGITVKLTGVTESQLLDVVGTDLPNSTAYPNMVYEDWFWFPDPWAYADWLIGPINYGTSNIGYYSNPTVNALLTQADATINQTARGLIYQHVDEIVYNDAANLWTGEYLNSVPSGIPVASINLRGFVANPQFTIMDWSQLYLS